ncbi:hypothetical protein [Alkalibacillus aidingensis]|uniref:hypothetical protein n=1 Tax=Alkalibacillus aidingensis TaxID=2747607 RepID=UPI0016617817|nr:hypothetical protein [Alkalibacillus aidingensis]
MLITMQQNLYHQEQYQWSYEQHKIQNLISISIHELEQLELLTPSAEKQQLSLHYETGSVMVDFYSLDSSLLQLEITVETDTGLTFQHFTYYDV